VHGGRGGYGLVFSRVKGIRMPWRSTVRSYDRMRLALGCEELENSQTRARMIKPQHPTTP
jgi:hypothetical protein